MYKMQKRAQVGWRCSTIRERRGIDGRIVLMNAVLVDTDKTLAGQVAVVTGGGRGIGASIARSLARLGATTVI